MFVISLVKRRVLDHFHRSLQIANRLFFEVIIIKQVHLVLEALVSHPLVMLLCLVEICSDLQTVWKILSDLRGLVSCHLWSCQVDALLLCQLQIFLYKFGYVFQITVLFLVVVHLV